MARLSRNLQVEDSSEDDVSEGEGSKEDMDEVELESPQPSVSNLHSLTENSSLTQLVPSGGRSYGSFHHNKTIDEED